MNEEEKQSLENKIKELEGLAEDLHEQFAQSFFHCMQLLTSIASLREFYYDSSHSRFVSEKSVEVAKKLGMNEADIYEVQAAGLLHDIGKLGFKDGLLVKFPNEMKESEYKQYATHPVIGKQILDKNPSLRTISEIVHQHHEKIDGSGFPNHLMGKEINPAAAIICVVDTYHNMIAKRPSSKPNSPLVSSLVIGSNSYLELTNTRFATAMNYLHAKSGNLFDTKVIEVFTDIIKTERESLGKRVLMRVAIDKLSPGMVIAESYYSSFGLLIASQGETITEEMKRSLFKLSEVDEVPSRILVMK